jgi:integrase/predicted nucleic acid-binding protein
MTDGDIHNRDSRIANTIEKLENLEELSEDNREILLDFKDYLYSEDLSKDRISRHLYNCVRLAPYIGFKLDQPEKKNLAGLVRKINSSEISKQEEIADATKAEYKKTIKKLYNHFLIGFRGEDLDEDLCDFFKVTVKKKLVDPDRLPGPREAEKLVKQADRIRDKAFLMVLWSSAGRIGELLGLKWKDVKFESDISKIRFRDTKTGDNRTVPLHAGFLYLKELQEADHKSDDPEAYVFRSLTTDGQLSYNGACEIINRVEDDAGIPNRIKTNPHAFRKGRATYLASQGMNQAQICEFGGWVRGSDEVAIYVRMAESDVEAGIRKVAGIKENGKENERDLHPVQCYECGRLNKFEAETCKNCDTSLNTSKLFEEKKIEEVTENLVFDIAKNEAGIDKDEIREKAEEVELWLKIEQVQRNLELDIVPLYKEAAIIAHELSEKDRGISGNDSYIVGLALDDECTHLITADSTLLTSPAIKQVCDERDLDKPKRKTKY